MTAKTSAVLLAMALGALLPRTLSARQEEWEGKVIKEIRDDGFRRHRFRNVAGLLNAKQGKTYTAKQRDADHKALFATGLFADVEIKCDLSEGQVLVTVIVTEYALVESVTFRGNKVFTDQQLKTGLRVTPASQLNPWNLKQDRDALSEQYVAKGHHFSRIREEVKAGAAGVEVIWHITEGPMVRVDSIEISGNESVDASDLLKYLLSKESPRLLFIRVGSEPFVWRNIAEDIEHIKLYYRLEGWLDIYPPAGAPEHVFLEDLVFSPDKTSVVIKYHVDEGRRYTIRNIKIRGNSEGLFTEEEILSWLLAKPGAFFSENNASRDIKKIRDKYGERAYIMAEVEIDPLFLPAGHELDLVITIKENQKMFAGKITIQGNTKTRDDVIRRYLTLQKFLPGEEFNARSLTKGVNQLRGTGWFGGDPADPDRGVSIQHAPGGVPSERDVTLEVKEAQTGAVRFAAGYSSAFGILGVLEINQRNFDITDWPKSFEDLINGTGFAGGGQMFRLRLAPAARRQNLLLEFREPFVFGYEFGAGFRGYTTRTVRESWDESRIGGSFFIEKGVDVFRFEVAFTGYKVAIDDVDSDAPLAVKELEGRNTLLSITPAIVMDTRDSNIFPSSGAKILLSWEYAGQVLGGDFDFNKISFDTEFFFPLFATESNLKHVLSLQFTFAWVEEAGDSKSVPLFERFYAGGRGSIRGFEFRGVGPRENGDPVGGEAYVYASVEYSFPLFTEILRGAVFWDIANLTETIDFLHKDKFRNTIGFGIRFIIPQLSNIPVAIDFGFPLTLMDDDEEQTITFDIGRLF